MKNVVFQLFSSFLYNKLRKCTDYNQLNDIWTSQNNKRHHCTVLISFLKPNALVGYFLVKNKKITVANVKPERVHWKIFQNPANYKRNGLVVIGLFLQNIKTSKNKEPYQVMENWVLLKVLR